MKKKKGEGNILLTIILAICSVAWMYPIFMILMNSLKVERAINTGSAFQLPSGETFAGLANYANAINSQGFLASLWYSFFITVTSVIAIVICCSMCAWYISRVQGKISNALYYLFVFSMVVPFQMVMFTLSQTADHAQAEQPLATCGSSTWDSAPAWRSSCSPDL